MKLEVCVDNVHCLQAAIAGGADRIELCAALELGGLTPSSGLMQIAGKAKVSVFAMIRPQGGGFCLTQQDVKAMCGDIAAARQAGLHGVVFGATTETGRLDGAALEMLLKAAEGMQATLHRAFDMMPDLFEALEQAIDLGFSRVLTSGGAKDASAGAETLGRLHHQARGRIGILPGAGITPENVGALLNTARFDEVHASCSRNIPTPAPIVEAGFSLAQRRACDPDKVRALRVALGAKV